MRLLILITILLLSVSSIAQKKSKKGVYDDYWKQQEQLEKFDVIIKEAHKQFQDGKLKLALSTYEEALKLNPKDQKTIAKIRDIKILLEKKDTEKLVAEKQDISIINLPPDTATEMVTAPQNDTVFLERTTVKKETEPIQKVTTPTKDTIPVTTPKSKPIVKVRSKPQNEKITEPTDKPYKNTENFRKYLATLYKEGWTEEKYEEGNKKIVKRVHIYGDRGDEYQQVTHHYGAVFYFKNGLSISYGTWVGETKEMK